jgi:predicted DsbA family dithiol-disulfide isomerase
MLVEVWSDVVCPWCYIGKRRLEHALAEFEHADQVEVVWRAFELDPGAPARREGDYVGRLARKYGMSRQQAQAANDNLTAMAAKEGLEFHFDQARPGNTFGAHRLLHWALVHGRQDDLKERLMRAYFTEGEAIGEEATLVRLADEVGLDPAEAAEVLSSGRYGDEVRAEELRATEYGATGVPFFVVGQRFAVPGAQDAETMLTVLRRAWDRTHPEVEVVAPGGTCDGDSCAV